MEYPVYRKYPNNKSFFRITSPERFEEIKHTGSKAEKHSFEAKTFPDRQFIQDMLNMQDGFWLESSEGEFNLELKKIHSGSSN